MKTTPKQIGGPPSKVRCRVCLNEIYEGAKKCTECESFQNWRRHLVLGTTTLTLVIALLSVLGSVAPKISRIFDPPADQVEIQVVAVSAARGEVRLVASNAGERAGVIHSARIRAPESAAVSQSSWELFLISDSQAPDYVLRPGETRGVSFGSNRILPNLNAVAGKMTSESWCLSVQVVRSDGTEETRSFYFSAVVEDETGNLDSLVEAGFVGVYPLASSDEAWEELSEPAVKDGATLYFELAPRFRSAYRVGQIPVSLESVRIREEGADQGSAVSFETSEGVFVESVQVDDLVEPELIGIEVTGKKLEKVRRFFSRPAVVAFEDKAGVTICELRLRPIFRRPQSENSDGVSW